MMEFPSSIFYYMFYYPVHTENPAADHPAEPTHNSQRHIGNIQCRVQLFPTHSARLLTLF